MPNNKMTPRVKTNYSPDLEYFYVVTAYKNGLNFFIRQILFNDYKYMIIDK